MQGLLSNVFGEDEQGGQSSQSNHAGLDASEGVELSPSITVEHHAGETYENPDGSHGEWSSDTSISMTADVGAMLGAAGSLDSVDTSDA